MRVVSFVACIAAGVVALTACSDQGICTEDVRPAVEVEIREAGTEQFLAGLARGILRDGTFEDSLRIFGVQGSDPAEVTSLAGADERTGTYELHVVALGYASFDTAGIVVGFDGCHVETAKLTIRLEPTSQPAAP
jgi:hypothetical protein